MDPRDRIVDYALLRLLRGPEERDLSERVRRAWERGVPGSSLEDLDREELERAAGGAGGSGRRARRARARWLRVHLPAAAAVLAVALGGRWWIGRRAPAVATLSRPLPVLEGDRWLPGGRDALAAGEPAFVDGGGPVTVGLPGGGELVVEPGGLFALSAGRAGARPAQISLEWGAVELRAPGGGPVALATAGATVTVAPGGRLAAQLAWDSPAPDPDALHVVEGTREALAKGALGRLAVTVIAGTARVDAAGWRAELAAGERQRLALETPGARPIDERGERELERVVDELLAAREPPPYPEPERWPARRLAALLESAPTHWLELEGRLARALADPAASDALWDEVLYLLSLDRGGVSARLARELYQSRPERFGVNALVALAERGLPRFHDELEAIVLHHDALAEERWIAPADRRDPLLPAAYLALRGDDLGRRFLVDALGPPGELRTEGAFVDQMVAALAIEELTGGRETPYRDCAVLLGERIRAELEKGGFEMAARAVLAWELFEAERERGTRLAWIRGRLETHVRSGLERLADPAQVEALAARLAGR